MNKSVKLHYLFIHILGNIEILLLTSIKLILFTLYDKYLNIVKKYIYINSVDEIETLTGHSLPIFAIVTKKSETKTPALLSGGNFKA